MKKFIDVNETNKSDYNKVVSHPLQSFEWGEFRKKTGIKVIRRALNYDNKIIDGFTLTIHKIPFLPYFVGYLPKGNLPTKEILDEITRIGKQEKCVFIQLEPNILKSQISNLKSQIEIYQKMTSAFHPLFTKYTFVLDLSKTEEELLLKMHPKTRYNIRLAQKKGVEVFQDNSKEGFNEYLELVFETTERQQYYAHNNTYHLLLWETINSETAAKKITNEKNKLTYHLLNAKLKDSEGKVHTLASWVLFAFHDTLYYPYGASSSDFREVMASNILAWEAIKFGKKLGLKSFDLWGAIGPEPDKNDPWYGFHRFKQGYGATLTEFVGSLDLVINSQLYQLYKVADKARWALLKFKKRIH